MSAEPRTAGHRKLPREVRAQQVLGAAVTEFGTSGYAAASLAAVAERAGVSKALVLTYFGSKEQLYVACVDRAGQALVAAIEQVITTPQPAHRMAAATLGAIFTALEDQPHAWNVINDRSLPAGGAGDTSVRAVRRTIAEQARRGIEGLADLDGLQDADDVAMMTDVWMGAVSAVVSWWLRHPGRSAEEMAERSTRLIAMITRTEPAEAP